MTLPTTVNTTYTAATPVLSADLNDIQACIVGAKRPSMTRWIPPSTPNVLGSGNSLTVDSLVFGASNAFTGMPLGSWFEGDRITKFAVRLKGAGTTYTIGLTLFVNRGDGSPSALAVLAIVNAPASWATYTMTVSPHVMAAADSLFLSQSTIGGAASDLGPVGVTSDRL